LVRRILVFFFSSRRRHTRFDCDWSSDVCSSDLFSFAAPEHLGPMYVPGGQIGPGAFTEVFVFDSGGTTGCGSQCRLLAAGRLNKKGRGAWWGRGEISGVGGSLKKKKKNVIESLL